MKARASVFRSDGATFFVLEEVSKSISSDEAKLLMGAVHRLSSILSNAVPLEMIEVIVEVDSFPLLTTFKNYSGSNGRDNWPGGQTVHETSNMSCLGDIGLDTVTSLSNNS